MARRTASGNSARNVFASDHLFADDTPVPVLDPGRGRTKTGRLWVYARDDRRWAGPAPPAAVYIFAPDRKAMRPVAHLQHFRGVLQVDGYAGFEQLTRGGHITLAACWVHARRKFEEIAEATISPMAAKRCVGSVSSIASRRRSKGNRPMSDVQYAAVNPPRLSNTSRPGSINS